MRSILLLIAALLLSPTAPLVAQSSSLFLHERSALARDATLSVRRLPVSVAVVAEPEVRTFATEQLITIIIREEASSSTRNSVETSRESSIQAKVEDWVSVRTVDGQLRLSPTDFAGGTPRIRLAAEREFEGSGDANRRDSLTARVTARILEVKPNGNLLIEGSRLVSIDEDSYWITITGVCRSGDISPDNTILSTQIAELVVTKRSAGPTYDATKRSVLHRLLDKVNLF